MNEELYFSLAEFTDKLDTSNLSSQEKAIATEVEIKRVENLKINIVDDHIIDSPETAVHLSGQIDSYIIKLQQFLCELPTKRTSITNLSAGDLQNDRAEGLDKIEELGQGE